MMKLAILFISSLAYAAVGDHAPAIPSTYLASHPRLWPPDSNAGFQTYLDTVWTARANATRSTGGSKYVFDAASGWAGPATETFNDCRYLVIAYKSDKRNSGPNHAAYLASIQAINKQGWEDVDAITGAAWSAGTATLTVGSATGNYSVGEHVSVSAVNPSGYNTKDVVLTAVGSTTISFALVSNPGAYVSGGMVGQINSRALPGSFCEAMAYDAVYADLGATAQAAMLQDLKDWSTLWETGLASIGPSPYNDVAYIDDSLLGMPVAIAQYPDGGAASLGHLKYAMDYYFNTVIPVWQQLWGPTGIGSTDSTNNGTGCWHEPYSEYMDQSFGIIRHVGPTLLSWARATNNYPGLFTTTYPWVKNIAACLMYQTRPDMTLERINASANGGWLQPEYNGTSGAALGTLELLGDAYNDPTVRGWARLMDWANGTPYGIEPSAFPFALPDNSGKSANTRAGANSGGGLPLVRNFTGYGTYFRTGWGESDTTAFLECYDHHWSHDNQENGMFTIYSRGALAIRSSSYQAGSASNEYYQYGKQAVSNNVVLVKDPADTYPSETVTIINNDGTTSDVPMVNEGGQRRVGSGFQQPVAGSSLAQVMQSPYDQPMWNRAREIYHGCTNVGFAVNAGYAYAAIDLTAAYNNLYSRNTRTAANQYDQPNLSNRTARVQRAVRNFVWIPRGTAAYVVIYDQITSTNSSFQKTWLLHSIEQPTVSSNHFTITRNRTTAALQPVNFCSSTYNLGLANCVGGVNYTYAGQLDGWMVLPTVASSATACVLGGAGHEFDIGATTNSSCVVTYGTNYNQCQSDQCVPGIGVGSVDGVVTPDQTIGASEPGAWRIEEKPGSAATADLFLNVMFAQSVGSGVTITVAPSMATSGTNKVATWTDSLAGQTCAYTLTLPIAGVGGTLTAAGAGCATVIN